MFSIPDKSSHKTKLADWVELSCIRAADGKVGFGTLVSASDMSRERQPEDIAEEDIWEDDLVISVQNEINQRRKFIGVDYPFRVDDKGDYIEFLPDLTQVGAVYLFCLFLSHATDRSIIPADLAPAIDNVARDLFQACATVAAAGYVHGNAMSFGWPRPDGAAFLAALRRIYALFGDGLPHAQPHWFERQPATQHENAMFMPFCLDPQGHDDQVSAQEVLVDYMQHLTGKYGTIIYRYRMAHHAAEGLRIHARGGYTVERVADLQNVVAWVQAYSEMLRAA